MINILIADDHEMLRDGLTSLINELDGIQVITQAGTGKAVLDIIQKEEIHLILMDISMPEMDGITAAAEVKKKYPEIKIIMLSMLTDRTNIEKALAHGVEGYLPKDTGKAELELAIKTVNKGQTYYSQQITQTIMEGLKSSNTVQPVRLTKREKEVLALICAEDTTQEIADKLFISFNTVETHRKNLLHKTGSKNSLSLLKFAIENGLYGNN